MAWDSNNKVGYKWSVSRLSLRADPRECVNELNVNNEKDNQG